MRRNNLFAKFIITLTLVALLTIPVGRVTGVFALAQPVAPELAPVFDTQIYQITDYVDDSLTDPQRGIFYLILGAWAAAQAGTNDYELVDPYTTSDGVTGWLKSTGIQLYNSMLALEGGNVYDPVTGTDITPLLSGLVGYALGAAGLAKNYNTESDFLNDVNSQDHYFVPFDPVLQASINAYFGRSYGLWNWQFDEKPWKSNDFIWNTFALGSLSSAYNDAVNDLSLPHEKINFPTSKVGGYYYKNVVRGSFDNVGELVVFLNSETGYYSVVDFATGELGHVFHCSLVATRSSYEDMLYSLFTGTSNYSYSGTLNLSYFDTLKDAVQRIYDKAAVTDGNHYGEDLGSLAPRAFVGTSWATKQEIFNLSGLNFAQNDVQSYDQVPDNTLLDIKGLLTSILNDTDLLTIILNNLYDRSGTLITLPDIKVSISLPHDNPLPVNLNDIQEFTDNEYLDVVKERVNAFSDTVGSFVAFWHNTDYEIVYAVFGSALVVLLGAFIGKWGHS